MFLTWFILYLTSAVIDSTQLNFKLISKPSNLGHAPYLCALEITGFSLSPLFFSYRKNSF